MVEPKRKLSGNKKPSLSGGAKKPLYVPDDVRSFNERVAGERKRSEARRQHVATAKNFTIAPPTFVVAPPTFTLYVRLQR